MVTHKDRFIRFGYEWFERFLGKKIEEDEEIAKSIQRGIKPNAGTDTKN